MSNDLEILARQTRERIHSVLAVAVTPHRAAVLRYWQNCSDEEIRFWAGYFSANGTEGLLARLLQECGNKPATSGRCDCYNNHDSNSGRCTHRVVSDPTRFAGQAAICDECRLSCSGAGNRVTEGTRIQLLQMVDPDPIPAGSQGVVAGVRSFANGLWAQIDVNWDNGRSLMLVVPPDLFEIIPSGE